MARYIPYASHYNASTFFYGGQSSDEAIGTPASFSYSRALEHRRNPSQLTVLPGPRQLSQGVVTDLIMNINQVRSGLRYAFGNTGNVYKIDASNNITYVDKISSGSDGMLYRTDADAIYFAGQTRIHRYYPISGTPTFDVTLGPSKSTDTACYRTGGAATYTVPTTLSEGDQCTFQPDIEPLYSVKVKVVTKGTGSLTLALHDGLNNTLASSTVSASSVVNGQVEFVFGAQIRAFVKPNARTYHFHLTSTVADTTVTTATAGQLSTADYEVWAYRLVQTVNGFHPMAQFQQFTCIGNGNYLAVWEPLSDTDPPNSEFLRHRLTFPAGFEVCGVTPTDEFLVIACAKYSSDGTKDFQEGKLFYWDGFGTTYNYVIDVSAGAPEGIYTHENMPYFFVNGTLCCHAGGKEITKVRTMANTDTSYQKKTDSTHVNPNMLAVRDGLLMAGYPSSTNNTAIEHGVYVWGSLEKNFPKTFNYGYVPSTMQSDTHNTDGTRQLGCVRNFGDEMYMSWKDGTAYGLDIIDSFCDPAPIFKFRARRFDGGSPYRDKTALKLAIATDPLPANTTLTAVSRINNDSYKNGQSLATGGMKLMSPVPSPKNFKRITYGFDGTCSAGSTTPSIYAMVLEYKPLIEQMSL